MALVCARDGGRWVSRRASYHLLGTGLLFWILFLFLFLFLILFLVLFLFLVLVVLFLTVGFFLLELHSLGQLVDKEGALEAHLHNGAVQTDLAQTCGIVGLFNLVETSLELDAFAIIGLLDRRCERCVGGCVSCKEC